MKNLMPGAITLDRQNGTRVTLPPCEHPPIITIVESEVVRYHGDIRVIHESYRQVTFPHWEDDPKGGPYVVSREVFDLLPADATEFVTPDFDTALKNGLGRPHVVNRFIIKPTAQAIIYKQMQQPTT